MCHDFAIILNGYTDQEGVLEAIQGFKVMKTSEPMLDLAAYRWAAQQVNNPTVCFLNSYSRVLADNWLRKMDTALAEPGVGIVGATGSWESHYSRVALVSPESDSLNELLHLYHPHPNPHIRTTAFMMKRDLWLDFRLYFRNAMPIQSKEDAWYIESGRYGLTRWLKRMSLDARVVGIDRPHIGAEWWASGTFRSNDQENLLIADNHTDEWANADPETQRILSAFAWNPDALRSAETERVQPPVANASGQPTLEATAP